MNSEARVSAIVINWNGKHFLSNCINSLLKQDYSNIEIIVVDCVSKDGSVEFLKNNYGSFDNIKLIFLDKDPGPPGAINYAVSLASGERVLILNNDIVLPPDCVSKMYMALSQDKNSVINVVQLNFKGEFIPCMWYEPWISSWLCLILKPFTKRVENSHVFYPSIACCLVDKSTLTKIPLNDKLFLYEDVEWGWRLYINNIKINVLLNTYFLHADAGTVRSTPKQAFVVGRNMLATPFICFSLPYFFLFLPILLLEFFRRFFKYISLKQIKLAWYFVKGVLDFFFKLSVFNECRKSTQAKREISDRDVVRFIIKSRMYAEEFKKSVCDAASNFKNIVLPEEV